MKISCFNCLFCLINCLVIELGGAKTYFWKLLNVIDPDKLDLSKFKCRLIDNILD